MSARSSSRKTTRRKPGRGLLSRLLDPIDLLSEVIFSILIMLTFTLAYRIFLFHDSSSHILSAEQVDELLFAALGATLAWGLIDGVMYALMEVLQRSERHHLLRQLQGAHSRDEGVDLIADELDSMLEPITTENQRRLLYADMFESLRASRPQPVGFTREDFAGALSCVVVAIIAVLPSLLPLLLLREQYRLAITLSNMVSFAMLFAAGFQWGRYTGASPWRTGLLLVTVGILMVIVAIPLGG